jgi:hypothetical protein
MGGKGSKQKAPIPEEPDSPGLIPQMISEMIPTSALNQIGWLHYIYATNLIALTGGETHPPGPGGGPQ